MSENSTSTKIAQIAERFLVNQEVLSIAAFGGGHINDTYKVITSSGAYVLQRINHAVFKRPDIVMDNIQRVSEHVNSGHFGLKLPAVLSVHGQNMYVDKGNYWRMMEFIPHGEQQSEASTAKQAYESGRMYGMFLAAMKDLPVEDFEPTIPRFHDINFRLDNFDNAVSKNSANRLDEMAAQIEFVEQQRIPRTEIQRAIEAGTVPLRLAHNDSKFNNVLLDETGKGLTVIDLDTLMPGIAAYDFGDSIRSIATFASEDESNLEKVTFEKSMYEAYAKGFLKHTKDWMTPDEVRLLPEGARLMTFIMGIRFLTDYLEGDTYYKISYPDQNKRRCLAQFKLLQEMEREAAWMSDTISALL